MSTGGLRVAFRMKPAGPLSWLVKVFTGVPVHVELVFSDGRAFRCVPRQRCQFVGPQDYAEPDWRVLDLAPLKLDEARVREACRLYDGACYDLLRACFGWWLGLDFTGRAICSEVTADAIAFGGGPASLSGRPAGTPRRLHAALLAALERAEDETRAQRAQEGLWAREG